MRLMFGVKYKQHTIARGNVNKIIQHNKTTLDKINQNVKYKNKLFFAILIAVVCLVIVAVLIFIPNFELAYEKNNMTKHLENRYKISFDVYNIRREGQGIGVKGSIFANAKPKDGSTDEFLVRKWGSSYIDEYPEAVYNEREKVELSGVVKKLSVKPSEYSVDVSISPSIYDKVESIPDLAYIVGEYSNDINYGVKVSVSGYSPTDYNVSDLKMLASYVSAKNPTNNSVRYVIKPKGGGSSIVCQYYNNSKNIDKTCFVKY